MLKSGVGRARARRLLKGRGDNLPDPLDMGPLGTPVTAQLLNYQIGRVLGGQLHHRQEGHDRALQGEAVERAYRSAVARPAPRIGRS